MATDRNELPPLFRMVCVATDIKRGICNPYHLREPFCLQNFTGFRYNSCFLTS